MINYSKIVLTVILTNFFLNTALAQNLDNSCKPFLDKEVDQIINDISLKRFSITELTPCQSKSYKLFAGFIKKNSDYFEYADISIRSDPTFIKNFVKNYPNILSYISPKLKSDPVFFDSIARIYSKALEYASYDLVDNKSFMKKMVSLNSRNFLYASARLQNNFDFVLFTVEKDGKMLRYASSKMRNNNEIVLNAMASYALAAGYASQELQDDELIQDIIKNSNYSFLIGMNSFLQDNYGGTKIGPKGSRGYRIVNQGQFFDKKPEIDRKDFFKWRYLWQNNKKKSARITTGKLRNLSWKSDLKKYPKLTKKIDKLLRKNLDQNTADSLTLTSLWKISSDPDILVFKLYLLRHVKGVYNKDSINNTSYLVGIAFGEDYNNQERYPLKEEDQLSQDDVQDIDNKDSLIVKNDDEADLEDLLNNDLEKEEEIKIEDVAVENEIKDANSNEVATKDQEKEVSIVNDDVEIENDWILTMVDSSSDINLENNIILKNNHKEYEFWDIYKNQDDNISNLIFKVKGKNSEYFEIFSRQLNDVYKPIFKGGGYSFN